MVPLKDSSKPVWSATTKKEVKDDGSDGENAQKKHVAEAKGNGLIC